LLGDLLKKIVGSKNERELKRLQPLLLKVNILEPSMEKLSDEEMRGKTAEYREKIDKGMTLDDILPEAYALVREASKRTLRMRPFDVQIIGAIILHQGKIAEMKTGEGKTLVATMPLYLNALSGKGVHLVTVNDYLAKRDSEWMGDIYNFLGLSVGVIVHEKSDAERQEAYSADITYGTNNEFGFDYLRDNMKFELKDMVQRELNYAIVDEVDSILIDEARTPLIISGPAEESTETYYHVDRIIPRLNREKDYTVEEKTKTVALTEEGVRRAEEILSVDNLYDPSQIELLHHVNQGLRAHVLFKRDVDYMVKDGQVIIVDEFTGRLMPGRRWSDGLHQAIEAKEGVTIENENQTLATITFQNYFRMYKKLAGMTGTADTEAAEFKKIYNLDVNVIPTNLPMIRTDHADVIYKTQKEKFNAVLNEILDLNSRGRPVLAGTISIEKSEILSRLLDKRGIPHNVLNAKHHEKEAMIIAQAGRKGAVTISTNMAGRGVDIILGGNPEYLFKEKIRENMSSDEREVLRKEIWDRWEKEKKEVISLGGVLIIGTERHEARRIDNQLRGRSGRQGDPGSSRFYLSLEDDLLRIFGSDRLSKIMDRLGMEENVPIEHPWVTKALENAQKRVESHNFEIRKHLLEYDDVMNKQREVIYSQRKTVLKGDELRSIIQETIEELIDFIIGTYINEDLRPDEWDWAGLEKACQKQFSLKFSVEPERRSVLTKGDIKEMLNADIQKIYTQKEIDLAEPLFRHLEKVILLQAIDSNWKDHLLSMDHLKEGIGLRGYGQRDPLIEYKKEAFDMFQEMVSRIKDEAVERLFRVEIPKPEDISRLAPLRRQPVFMSRGEDMAQPQTVVRKNKKVGRNDPCPCGSGKKYKKCCGR